MRVLMFARIPLWSEEHSGGITSQLVVSDGVEDNTTSIVVAVVSVVRVGPVFERVRL